jgi:simple sugar transport system ATP-binding protein
MVGSELPSPETRESTVTDGAVLEVRDLPSHARRPPLLDDVELHHPPRRGARHRRRRGQRPGRAGRGDHGHAPLDRHGRARGDDITPGPPGAPRGRDRLHPEDRHRHGLLLDAPLWENRILGHQTERPTRAGSCIDRRRPARHHPHRREYDVRTPGIDVPAGALSGGNQQKLIVGREMSHDPKVLIAAHPTRGVDVGAQAAIWDHIRRPARRHGRAADLRRPRRADRPVRHAAVIYRGRFVAAADPAT